MAVDRLVALVERSALPAQVAVSLEQLNETGSDVRDRLSSNPGLAEAVIAVFGASRALSRLVIAHPDDCLGILQDLDRRPTVTAESPDRLVAWKQSEYLRIAARDLLGVDALEQVGAALAQMAADVFVAACVLTNADDLAVIGMGKCGGRELNYASDVDVLFVGGSDAEARAILAVVRRCFRVDVDLRPEGRQGPLTRSLDSYEAYWDRWADAWEFQALLKARPIAGETALGRAFAEAAATRVWGRPFTADDLRAIRTMKARSESEIAKKGLSDREVKRGRGGIRDIEFAVQLLQLVHGRQDAGLRSPTTLDALAELSGAGYVDPRDAGSFEDAYRFLRTVEHRLQLVEETQVHAVPVDPTARSNLARVLGYRDVSDASALDQLDEDLRQHQTAVRSIHERLYFRPLLELFAGVGSGEARLSARAAEERLAAFGFADAERTRQALRELTKGLTRSSRLMKQLLPLMLEWLSETADPDLGLLGLRNLASGPQRTTELTTAFRESPEVARRLCLLLGTSRLLGDTLIHNPDLIPDLADSERLASRARRETEQLMSTAVSWRDDARKQAQGLARLKRREELRVAARDVLGEDDLSDTEAALTDLAEGVLATALRAVDPQVPVCLIAMGRLGGGELSYASDLDVLFVYEGTTSDEFAAAEAAAESLLKFVNGATPAFRIYELDADLRPEGRQGPLARSLDAYRTYYRRWAATWELQALVRARPVAGDPDIGSRYMEMIEPFVWRSPFPTESTREIRRMKARVERERIPAGEDPAFHLKLGRGSLSDVEWTTQLLQLQHSIHAPGTIAAIAALEKAGVLQESDARVLSDSYRFCERTRNRWFLIRGQRGDALPTQAGHLARLARSLDMTPSELRETYRRVTRRARLVVERLFYGRTA